MARPARPCPRVSCVLVAVVAVLLAGCRATLSVEVEVDPDGAGQLGVVLTADEALLEASADAGVDPLEHLAAVGRELADEGWVVEDDETETGGRSVRVHRRFDDPAAFNALTDDLGDALAAPEARLLERLTLDVDEEHIRLEGGASLEPGPGVAEHGLDPDEAATLLAAEDAFALEVIARLPGELVETTAADPTRPLRWSVEPGERVEILAVTERPAPWWEGPGVAAGAAGLVALAVLVLVVGVHRRRRGRWISRRRAPKSRSPRTRT